MKQLKNKSTQIQLNQVFTEKNVGKKVNEITGKADYSDLIEHVCNVVPQGGFTYTDINGRNRIMSALKKAREEKKEAYIKLEDSDVEFLQKITKESRWGFLSSDLQEFLEDVDKIYFTN